MGKVSERTWQRRTCCWWRGLRGLVAVDGCRGHGVTEGGSGGGRCMGKVSGRGQCRVVSDAGCVAS